MSLKFKKNQKKALIYLTKKLKNVNISLRFKTMRINSKNK